MSEVTNIPKKIKIDNYTYTFKYKLKNIYYSFRYKFRKTCNIILIISLEELKKYINKEQNIKYEIKSTNKAHQYKDNINTEEDNISKISNKNNENQINDEIELSQAFIFTNLDKHLDFIKLIWKIIIYIFL